MNTYKRTIDTNVVVAGLKSKRGTSHALLQLIGKDKFECNLSVPLVLEYEKVLLDPKLKIPFTKAEKFGIQILTPKQFLEKTGEVR